MIFYASLLVLQALSAMENKFDLCMKTSDSLHEPSSTQYS
jgi:hypothetical protein